MSGTPEQFYRAGEVPALLSVSRSEWFDMVGRREFPAADYVLPGMSLKRGKRWSATAIARWQESRRVELRALDGRASA
jgi:predicted DNA-binding transcriptional regulator AlpA